jgi:hypothetical protein
MKGGCFKLKRWGRLGPSSQVALLHYVVCEKKLGEVPLRWMLGMIITFPLSRIFFFLLWQKRANAVGCERAHFVP